MRSDRRGFFISVASPVEFFAGGMMVRRANEARLTHLRLTLNRFRELFSDGFGTISIVFGRVSELDREKEAAQAGSSMFVIRTSEAGENYSEINGDKS